MQPIAPSRLGRLLVLPLLLAAPSLALPQEPDGVNWPQWRGPERTGVSTEAGWSAVGAPAPLWRKSLGLGHSSFAVVDGLVYTLGYDVEEGLDNVFCLDAATGEEKWTYSYPSEIWDVAHDGGTLTTPTVVDGAVLTSNREGKVFCFDAASGDVRWKRDLRADLELEPPTWGFSASPLVIDDLVVMNVDRIVALDLATGEDRWVTEKQYGIAYSTPASFERAGRSLLASLSGDGVVAIDLADGSEIAFYSWVKPPQIYPMTPVVIDDRIFVSGGYDRGCAMLQLTDEGITELWSGRVMRNKMSGCVLHEGHLFGFDESILKCIDLEGKMKWRVRGLGTGSMTIAGDRLVILDGKGQVIVADANPEEYVELSKQSVFDDGTAWSSPVLSGGRIYCRSSKGQMACLDHSRRPALAIGGGAGRSAVPTADALVARHIAALGGEAALAEITALRMTGGGESLRNTVRKGTVEFDWVAGEGFSWKDDSGFQLAFHGDLGWVIGLRTGPALLEDESLDAAREAGDLTRVFDPSAYYASMTSKERTVFDNRPCFSVAATTREGHARTLYFDVETGLLAGHDGEGILMWTLGEYRKSGGVLLPTKWAFYEPEAGEMSSATFEDIAVQPTDDAERFAIPPIVQLLLRTPEEIAADNERLRELHAAILGTWRSPDAPDEHPDDRFVVDEGFLLILSGERPPAKLSEPDESGSMVIIGAEYVSVTPVANEDGDIVKIEIRVGGELEETLERKED